MNLGLQHDPDLEPKRAKTLFISICIHIAIFVFLMLNPDLLVQAPRRIVRNADLDAPVQVVGGMQDVAAR